MLNPLLEAIVMITKVLILSRTNSFNPALLIKNDEQELGTIILVLLSSNNLPTNVAIVFTVLSFLSIKHKVL